MTTIAPPILHAAGQAECARRPALAVDDVSDLVRSMMEATERLSATHEALRAQVVGLKRELAEANDKLRRSRALAALGEMAAGIAHEVRTPLASILLDSQLLQDDLAARPDQAALCTRIRGAVQRLDTVVGDVLAFARDTRIRRAPIETAMLLQAGAESCAGVLARSGIDLVVKEPRGSWLILGDESLLVQALGNVIRNAVEALMESDGAIRRIVLAAERRRRRMADGRTAERIVIKVDDTGPGMPPDVVQRMFNPFFTTRRAGTGLGLAIVHRIVDAHGGEIDVSSARGRGTSIALCLPMAGPQRTGVATRHTVEPTAGSSPPAARGPFHQGASA